MDSTWLIISAALVFTMQAGFLCLESGKVRSKNSVNVATKNVADFVISSAIYWSVGFAIMFGDTVSGLFGKTHFFFGTGVDGTFISFFIFQLMFCGTTSTLLSGAVAERMSFFGYIVSTVVLSLFIFPFVGHWVWYETPLGNGWLKQLGFYDFAGATVVHSVGGWVALAAIIIIGPRLGRFSKKRQMPQGSNIPLATLGVFLIWFGWFGFNGGSTLKFDDTVPLIILNTCIGAVFGALSATAMNYVKAKSIDITIMLNGIIAGLVSVTAGANAFSPLDAMMAGGIAGILFCLGLEFLEKLKLDDALSVIPAHLLAGMWGTFAVAIYADLGVLDNGLTRGEQLWAQTLGITVIGIYSFFISYTLLITVNFVYPLRVSKRAERIGMNVSEHGITTETLDLLSAMKMQAIAGEFQHRVKVEPFTEIGQIATQYNRVIQRVKDEIISRDRALSAFNASESRKSAILESSMDGIISINKLGEITEFNPAAERLFSLSRRQAVGLNIKRMIFPATIVDKVEDAFATRFSSSGLMVLNRRNSIKLRRLDGTEFPAEVTLTSNEKSDYALEYTLHIRDVSKHQKMQNKLHKMAFSDALTGLHNRAYFLKCLDKALEKGVSSDLNLAVYFLDLDRFKSINDTLGHKAGDILLCEVAIKLRSITRKKDIIARWGGDEFVFMMTGNFTRKTLEKKANEVLDCMCEPVQIENKTISLQTSIGIATCLLNSRSLSSIEYVQQADIAMYEAKKKGRNKYRFFLPEMAEKAKEQFDFELALKKAVQSEQGLHVVYQAKFDSYRRIVGMEALLRWEHADKGLISPAIFIPIAEKTEMIVALGNYTISTVFHQISQWQDLDVLNVPIAINLSARNLLEKDLVNYVFSQIEAHRIDPSSVEFEITESVMLEDIDRCIEVLRAFKDKNIRISVDDFGTGYSSLSYLKKLPLDVLKIDRSFVMDAIDDNEDKEIINMIITLAKSLKLSTVAEGIEHEDQFTLLKELGVDYFQGYLFAKPLPANDVMELFEAAEQSS